MDTHTHTHLAIYHLTSSHCVCPFVTHSVSVSHFSFAAILPQSMTECVYVCTCVCSSVSLWHTWTGLWQKQEQSHPFMLNIHKHTHTQKPAWADWRLRETLVCIWSCSAGSWPGFSLTSVRTSDASSSSSKPNPERKRVRTTRDAADERMNDIRVNAGASTRRETECKKGDAYSTINDSNTKHGKLDSWKKNVLVYLLTPLSIWGNSMCARYCSYLLPDLHTAAQLPLGEFIYLEWQVRCCEMRVYSSSASQISISLTVLHIFSIKMSVRIQPLIWVKVG